MADITDLIARLRGHLFGIEAADALTAQAATIETQAKELAESMSAVLEASEQIDQLEVRVYEQAREIEVLRADAERYRWLREHGMYKAPKVAVKDGYGGKELATGSDLDSAIDAAIAAAGKDAATDTDETSCRKCGGAMAPGIATGQTWHCGREGTCSPAGPGYVQPCIKCSACGWSVTANVAGNRLAR